MHFFEKLIIEYAEDIIASLNAIYYALSESAICCFPARHQNLVMWQKQANFKKYEGKFLKNAINLQNLKT